MQRELDPHLLLGEPPAVAAAQDDARRGRAAVAGEPEPSTAGVRAARGVARRWLCAAPERHAVGGRAAVTREPERSTVGREK